MSGGRDSTGIKGDRWWGIRTVILSVWIVAVWIGGVSFILGDWVNGISDINVYDESWKSTASGLLLSEFIEFHGFLLDAVILTVKPAWPDVSNTIYGESLHTSRLNWLVARFPFTISGVNLSMDWRHIVANYRTDNVVRAIPEARTIVIPVPNNSSNCRGIGGH